MSTLTTNAVKTAPDIKVTMDGDLITIHEVFGATRAFSKLDVCLVNVNYTRHKNVMETSSLAPSSHTTISSVVFFLSGSPNPFEVKAFYYSTQSVLQFVDVLNACIRDRKGV